MGHPLEGLIQLKQVILRLGKEPQGSALQVKENLIQELKAKLLDTKLTLWDITSIMDHASTQILNVVQREPQLQRATEMEVVAAVANIAIHTSRKQMDNKSSSTALQIGAAKIHHKMLQDCETFLKMS